MIYAAHGSVGVFNFTYFVNALVQGLVLLGASTQITKLLANYAFDCDGTSLVYSNNQNLNVSCPRAVARTAALAGLQTEQFFASLDPDHTADMSSGRLFKNLRLMVGGNGKQDKGEDGVQSKLLGLNDFQIAEVVRDVAREANLPSGSDEMDPVSMGAFLLRACARVLFCC